MPRFLLNKAKVTPKKLLQNGVPFPNKPMTNIHNVAPGPPRYNAVAIPAKHPLPILTLKALKMLEKGDISDCVSFCSVSEPPRAERQLAKKMRKLYKFKRNSHNTTSKTINPKRK